MKYQGNPCVQMEIAENPLSLRADISFHLVLAVSKRMALPFRLRARSNPFFRCQWRSPRNRPADGNRYLINTRRSLHRRHFSIPDARQTLKCPLPSREARDCRVVYVLTSRRAYFIRGETAGCNAYLHHAGIRAAFRSDGQSLKC